MTPGSSLRIARAAESRTGFGDYEYDIFRGTERVARCGHDYRGGEHWIRFGAGATQACALGPVWTFTERDGAEPLVLTAAATDYLERRLADDPGR